MTDKGYVYLIGAGPGDPDLITLKGIKALQKADVVIYDRLVNTRILNHVKPGAEMIYVGKTSGKHTLSQEEINKLLLKQAQNGKIVARLKGGDPFLFGRGGEEALYVKENGIDFEVIPGITSAIAVPAYSGIPVTHRDETSTFAVITGHEKPGKNESSIKWKEIATGIGTIVFLMGVENLGHICEQLLKHGRDRNTPVALIRWGTLPWQEVLTGTLENIESKVKQADFKPPAVIIVGQVVALRDKLKWIENKPLWAKRIVVTRARAQASVLVDRIVELGGDAIEFPTIKIVKEIDLNLLYKAFSDIDRYDWLIFTSVNAVDIFFDELVTKKMDIRKLNGINICAIGPITKQRLEARGIRVDIVPDEYRAEGILKKLKPSIKPGQWILLPRARGAREILPEKLRQWGAHVNIVNLYQAEAVHNVSRETMNDIISGGIDYLTFTSSSTVYNFVKIIGAENIPRVNRGCKVACIGPITAQTAEEAGFYVDLMASEYTIEGLVEAIKNDIEIPGEGEKDL